MDTSIAARGITQTSGAKRRAENRLSLKIIGALFRFVDLFVVLATGLAVYLFYVFPAQQDIDSQYLATTLGQFLETPVAS